MPQRILATVCHSIYMYVCVCIHTYLCVLILLLHMCPHTTCVSLRGDSFLHDKAVV